MSTNIEISSQIHVKRIMNQKMDTITSHKGISISSIRAWGTATGAGPRQPGNGRPPESDRHHPPQVTRPWVLCVVCGYSESQRQAGGWWLPAPERYRMSEDRTGRGESIDLYARKRAYDLVRAVLSDDHNEEHGHNQEQEVA